MSRNHQTPIHAAYNKGEGYRKPQKESRKDITAGTTDVVEFLVASRQYQTGVIHHTISIKVQRTIPVSADRCWDWKNTASDSPQLGQSLLDRGSWNTQKTPR